MYEELPDFNQEFEPDLFSAEMQMNRNAGVFTARAKNNLIPAYLFVLCGCKCNSDFLYFLGPVWGEYDCPTSKPSCEISRSKSHCCWDCR